MVQAFSVGQKGPAAYLALERSACRKQKWQMANLAVLVDTGSGPVSPMAHVGSRGHRSDNHDRTDGLRERDWFAGPAYCSLRRELRSGPRCAASRSTLTEDTWLQASVVCSSILRRAIDRYGGRRWAGGVRHAGHEYIAPTRRRKPDRDHIWHAGWTFLAASLLLSHLR